MANDFRNRFSLLGRPTHPIDPQKPSLSKSTPVVTGLLTPLDPKLIKHYFQLLQSLHHIEILEDSIRTGIPPLGMARKVTQLTTFIKPAAPDDLVLDQIKDNTLEYMIKNLKTLIKHYTHTIEQIRTNLGPFNKEALDRALRWAHQRYGRRLTPSSISALRLLLSAPDPPPPATPLLLSDLGAFPPLPSRPQSTMAPFKHRNTLILPSRPLTIPSLLTLPTPFPNSTRRLSTSTPQPPRPSRVPLPQRPQRLPATRPRPPPAVSPVRTPSPVVDPPCVLETNLGSPTPDPEPPVPIPTSSAPRPNRLSLAATATRRRLCPSSSSPALASPLPGQAEELSLSAKNMNILRNSSHQKSDPSDDEIHPDLFMPPPTTPAVVALTPLGKDPSLQDQTLPSVFSYSMHGSAYHRPRIHPHTSRKASAWSLPITKPIVITGDSNLARIPTNRMDDVQIDSFPGATLRHLTAILLKHTLPIPDTEFVLLSIGLNNCLRQQTTITIIKDTRRLIRTARTTFPYARIIVPLLTVSTKLSASQLLCVKSFNDFVKENIEDVDPRAGYLNTLSPLLFQTVHDNIHWTPGTAKSMLDDWLTQLDLLSLSILGPSRSSLSPP